MPDQEATRRYHREYQNAVYQRRKAAGLCTVCGKRPPVDGGARCDGCRKRKRRQDSGRVARMTPEQKEEFLQNNRVYIKRWERTEHGRAYRKAQNHEWLARVSGTEEYKRSRNQRYIRATYSLTPEAYAQTLADQNHCCALCGEPLAAKKYVDHCHRTGRVRGIIHPRCNALVGRLETLPVALNVVLNYLVLPRRRRIRQRPNGIWKLGHKHYARWRRYGITPEQYEQMLAIQNHCCALCSRPLAGKVDIDHCHRTGVVRGILHAECNFTVGFFEDRELLTKALNYIRFQRRRIQTCPT